MTFLDFNSRQAYFSMAQITWKGVALNNQGQSRDASVDLSHIELADVLWNLYGSLTFIEIAELYQAINNEPSFDLQMSWPEYFKNQQINFNENFKQLSFKLSQTTESFRNWCFTKKASSQDLMPINSLSDITSFNEVAPLFTELSISRTEGKQAIDWIIDLLMLATPVSEIKPVKNKNWITHLNRLRNPQTTLNDSKKEQAQQEHQWPQYVHIQSQRHGDRILKKMQITYSDNKDLQTKLQRLSQREL